MAYYLRHKRENRRASSCCFTQCQDDYYRMMRDDDGSIPWRMFCISVDGSTYELDPETGNILTKVDE